MLYELAEQDCPEPAIQSYREFLIGKAKGLKKILPAGSCDRAIRAGRYSRYGTDKPSKALLKLAEDYRRMPSSQCLQNKFHIENGWPVVFVRRAGTEWPEIIQDFLENEVPEGYERYLMEYDDEAVDRLAG